MKERRYQYLPDSGPHGVAVVIYNIHHMCIMPYHIVMRAIDMLVCEIPDLRAAVHVEHSTFPESFLNYFSLLIREICSDGCDIFGLFNLSVIFKNIKCQFNNRRFHTVQKIRLKLGKRFIQLLCGFHSKTLPCPEKTQTLYKRPGL